MFTRFKRDCHSWSSLNFLPANCHVIKTISPPNNRNRARLLLPLQLRAAYRVEVKRCHPDVAGDNEFRVKLLERRFQRLTSTWEKFVEEQTVPSQGSSSSRQAATATGRSARRSSERSSSSSATSEPGARRQSVQAQVARARNREQARAKAEQEAHAAAAAAVAARQKSRRVMDPGREILDAGGPSC